MVRAYRGHNVRMRAVASADMVVVEQVALTAAVSNRRGHIQSGAQSVADSAPTKPPRAREQNHHQKNVVHSQRPHPRPPARPRALLASIAVLEGV